MSLLLEQSWLLSIFIVSTYCCFQWTSFHKAHYEVDGLEISRSGHAPHTVRIKLLPAQTPERFSISAQLQSAIGEFLSPATAFTKQNIVMATWEYIKRKDLIKEDDCRVIVCDATLAQVFDCEQLAFASVVVALKPHLTPVNSIDLEYTLSLAGSSSESDDILDEKLFDVDVGAVDLLEKARERVLVEWEELNQEQQKDLSLLKQQESDIVERLHEHCRKCEWMHQFASDPVGFMKDVALSQQADQQVLSVCTSFWQLIVGLTRFCPRAIFADPCCGSRDGRDQRASLTAVLPAVGA